MNGIGVGLDESFHQPGVWLGAAQHLSASEA